MDTFLFKLGQGSAVVLVATFLLSSNSLVQAQAASELQRGGNVNDSLIPSKLPKSNADLMAQNTVIQTQSIDSTTPPIPNQNREPTVTVSKEEFDLLKTKVDDFSAEILSLKSLNSRNSKQNNFSMTTKLVGEGIVGFSGYGGVNETATRLGKNNVFSDRIRLNFDTSFMGKDRLRTRLQSRNTTPFNAAVTGTNMTRMGYDGNDGENNTLVSLFQYDLPLGEQTKVRIATVGYEFNDNQPTLNPLLASSGTGSISRFGRFNPIFRLSGDGASINVSQKLGDQLSLDLGYAVPAAGAATAANPAPSNGLFNGQNAILSQLTYTPSKDVSLALLYGRTYNNAGGLTGGTGSSAANNPFGGTTPTSANHYSFLATYKLSDTATISGWAGFIDAKRETAAGGSAGISNYAVTLGFSDFGAKGNTLGFVLGVPPKLNSLSTATTTGNPDTSLHLEALYKVKVTDNIDITPGLLLITNPEHNSANPTAYVGTVRTTFRF